MTVIGDLLYSVISVDIFANFQRRFFICFVKCSVLINNVVYSTVFLLKLTVNVVIILIVLELIVLICSFIIVCSVLLRIDRLRVVKSDFFFISLIVE